jgi:inner membrane protein YidH
MESPPDEPQRWPRSVYERGSEPDPRYTLANERTFLAWIRTSLALLAGAGALDALDLPLPDVLQRVTAGWLALIGLLCAIQSWRTWTQTERALRTGRPLPGSVGKLPVVSGVGVVAVVLIASVIFR